MSGTTPTKSLVHKGIGISQPNFTARSKPNDKKRDLRVKRIEPKPLIGFLLNPFGTHARSIDYKNGVVSINARRKQNIQVADLSAPPLVTKGFVGSTLNITVDSLHIAKASHVHLRATQFTLVFQPAVTRGIEASGGRGKRGLEIEVFDINTGKARPTATLSGGETFIAAQALALGVTCRRTNRNHVLQARMARGLQKTKCRALATI